MIRIYVDNKTLDKIRERITKDMHELGCDFKPTDSEIITFCIYQAQTTTTGQKFDVKFINKNKLRRMIIK